jgi:RNA polymerase sigma factor (sigma-70 family)
MGPNYKGLFQSWEIAVAKKLINEFKQKWTCLDQEEFDDLLQECLTHWYFSKGDYDPGRKASEKTFMGRVMRNKLTDLVRRREAEVRKVAYLSMMSDERSGDDEDPLSLIERMDQAGANEAPPDQFGELQLKMDLSKILQKLTPQQKSICDLLGQQGMTVVEASDYLKIPRLKVYYELK